MHRPTADLQPEQPLTPLVAEDEVRPTIYGVVTIHVKKASKVDLAYGNKNRVYLRCSVRNFVKRTRMTSILDGSCVWEQVKHIPVALVRARKHPFNLLRIDLVGFGRNASSEGREIGSVAFHLHDLVRVSPIKGTFDIFRKHLVTGQLQLEILFNYGLYGYGHSPQFAEGFEPAEMRTRYSLFPRVQPPADREDEASSTLIPCAVSHPSDLIPFNETAVLGYAHEVQPYLHDEAASDQRWSMLGPSMMRLKRLKERYAENGGRIDKIAFLHGEILAQQHGSEIVGNDVFVDDPAPHITKPFTDLLKPTGKMLDAMADRDPMSNIFSLHAMLEQQQVLSENYNSHLNLGQQQVVLNGESAQLVMPGSQKI